MNCLPFYLIGFFLSQSEAFSLKNRGYIPVGDFHSLEPCLVVYLLVHLAFGHFGAFVLRADILGADSSAKGNKFYYFSLT